MKSKLKQIKPRYIPDNWKEGKIGDVCSIRRGASPRPIHNFITDNGIPWVKISDASAQNTRFIEWTKEYIKEEGKPNTVLVKSGDLILSNSATPGIPKFMKIDAAIHDGWLLLNNFRNVNKEFLYYLLLNEKPNLVGAADGTVFKNLNTDIVRKHVVLFPPLSVQESITQILSTIDSKIELNQQMNNIIEKIIKSIFRSWFIDFDEETEFVDSEFGNIPKGWEISDIQKIFKKSENGGTPRRNVKEYWDNGTISWFKTGELRNGPLFESEEKINDLGLKNSSCNIWKPGTILVAMYGVTAGKLGILTQDATSNQACNALLAKDEYGNLFLFYLLLSIQQKLFGAAVGSAQQNLNKDLIAKQKIILPPASRCLTFHNIVQLFYQSIIDNSQNILLLEKMRKYLLSKLMSGELRI